MAMPRRSLRSHANDDLSPITSRKFKQSQKVSNENLSDFSSDLKKDQFSCESDYSDDTDSEGIDEVDRVLDSTSRYSINSRNIASSRDTNFATKDGLSPKYSSRAALKRRQRLYPDLEPLLKEDAEIKSYRKSLGPTPAIAIFMAFLLIVSVIGIWHFIFFCIRSPDEISPKSLDMILTDMKRNLKILYSNTQQTKHFWTQILSQFQMLTESSPTQPAILMMIVPSDSRKTIVCLSHTLLEIVSNAFGDSKFISFDTESHVGRSPMALKHELDDCLQGLSAVHAAAVYNIEKLAPEATMMFHAYCDHENAIFKRALILLTVELEHPYDSLASDRLDYTVHKYLMDRWTRTLREDDAAAIYSRISNAPVLVRPEDTAVIDKLCPY